MMGDGIYIGVLPFSYFLNPSNRTVGICSFLIKVVVELFVV